MTKGPILIDLETTDAPRVAEAEPVPDDGPAPQGQAMQSAAHLAARRPSRLARWFWGLAGALLAVALSVGAWDFATALLARSPALGWSVTALISALAVVLLLIAVRELSGIARLKRIDSLHHSAAEARASDDLSGARAVLARLDDLYAGREEAAWGRQRMAERAGDIVDAEDLLTLAEAELLTPLDAAARVEVEAAARQVAAVTALLPLPLADVITALAANMRMIRRIAEIYGGRAGVLGSWRLTRAVMTHLIATGAVAVGDDMLGSLAGGGLLSKLSRRFGEGVVNGALTARVGVAAMEVCRPLPFTSGRRPSVSGIVRRALTGLFPGT
ncbi:putative membrane protein [Salinihabitans flavidus]|uniref:Putative membrane protein n=1 Tax=Salinihabitans flavidus TaxID=569882 RepID=A0A1H8VHY8_9RHOB|nr:TIGR01620 family protein [Salinihabitans flavidus]SEP14910.1 putative membrane protein [Salinihabitans flavidus]